MAYSAKPLEVFEVLEKFEQLGKSRTKQVEFLKQNESPALRDVLRGTFDDAIQWNLPEGAPPYTPAIPESVPSTLLRQNRQFRYFVKGGPGDRMYPLKRESVFIGVLESVHPEDAVVVINMINKKQPAKGLTKKLVQEAFPELIVR